jgi:hypothetical protein
MAGHRHGAVAPRLGALRTRYRSRLPAGDTCLLAFAGGEQAYVLLDLHRAKDMLAMVRATYEETRAAGT